MKVFCKFFIIPGVYTKFTKFQVYKFEHDVSASIKIEGVKPRVLIKYLRLKHMIPNGIHQDLLDTSGKSAVLCYETVNG